LGEDIMDKNKIGEEIVSILKQELEYRDDYSYAQWLMGVSIKKSEPEMGVLERPEYIARTVVKTSTSPYVDGMDIRFTVTDNGVEIDPLFYENTPEFQGGEERDAINWMHELEEIFYIQSANPY
jgi:hypothetical protein